MKIRFLFAGNLEFPLAQHCFSYLILTIAVLIGEQGCNKLRITDISESGRTIKIDVKESGSDLTEEINSLFRTSRNNNIDTIIFSAGTYRISNPLYLYPGLTIEGDTLDETIIEQTTWGHPAFDILDTDSCSIGHLKIISRQDRRYPNGFVWRGGDSFVGNAGIYSNSHFGAFRHLSIKGFTCGINLSSWNGIGLYEQKTNNLIEDVQVDSVDFGLLITGQKNLRIAHVNGGYVQQNGSTASPHLIYFSGASDNEHVWTEDFILQDCSASNGVQGSAFQIGSARRGKIQNLRAENCMGILSGGNWEDLIFENLIAMHDQTHAVGSVFIRPLTTSNVRMNNIHIESFNPESRLLLLNGKGNTFSNIYLKSAVNRVWDHNLIVFEGEDSVLRGVRLENPSDHVGAVAVMLAGKNLMLEDLTCMGCRRAFNIHPNCEYCSVMIDSKKIIAPRNYGGYTLYLNHSGTSVIIDTSLGE